MYIEPECISILEHQPIKIGSFPIKARVKWVLSMYLPVSLSLYIYTHMYNLNTLPDIHHVWTMDP